MKYLSIFILLLFLFSCKKYEHDYDFRNYVRDQHPYCVLKDISPHWSWQYAVYDTVNNRIYVYHCDQYRVEKFIIK